MARKGKKPGLDFEQVAELAEKLEQLGGDLKEVAEEALLFIPGQVNPKLKAAMAKHRRTGRTEQSLVEGQSVTWSGSVGSLPVGFDIKNGGLPSIFLMYGTPRHAPRNQYGAAKKSGAEHPGMRADDQLKNAIYGTQEQAEIAKRQQKIFEEAIMKLLK